MSRIRSHMDEVNMIGKLADLKTSHYHNTLLLSALVDLLIEKGVITTQELQEKAGELARYTSEAKLPTM
ncbi:hypothetical protein [Paenibacillus turpanensis]|uniref:hypothetical protein n=1 Tax=Paenibacillus turpanensis TaxID=2689078 RepID=UPI0014074512|nr:hypothetical protein [Paenibacillus turpanensis]